MRCCRSLLPVVGRCCCCHRCCQPRWRGGWLRVASGRARTHPRPAPSRPGCGPCAPPLFPIGLTAATPIRRREVSRADLRVRLPGTFTCARCPAVRSALDTGPEAYHNPAAVWWGALQLPRSSGTRWSFSSSCVFRPAREVPRSGSPGSQCSVAYSARVIAVMISAGSGNDSVFGPPNCDVADDEQCDARVFPGVPHLVWG
jgi:hypothetical protein